MTIYLVSTVENMYWGSYMASRANSLHDIVFRREPIVPYRWYGNEREMFRSIPFGMGKEKDLFAVFTSSRCDNGEWTNPECQMVVQQKDLIFLGFSQHMRRWFPICKHKLHLSNEICAIRNRFQEYRGTPFIPYEKGNYKFSRRWCDVDQRNSPM